MGETNEVSDNFSHYNWEESEEDESEELPPTGNEKILLWEELDHTSFKAFIKDLTEKLTIDNMKPIHLATTKIVVACRA